MQIPSLSETNRQELCQLKFPSTSRSVMSSFKLELEHLVAVYYISEVHLRKGYKYLLKSRIYKPLHNTMTSHAVQTSLSYVTFQLSQEIIEAS